MRSLPILTPLLMVAAMSTSAVAAAPPIEGIPGDREVAGDAFVEAWLSFRRDLDTTAHGGVHPALLDEWMKAAPPFLEMDALRLSNEPSVILAAGHALLERPYLEVRELIEGVARANSKAPVSIAYRALLVEAGDRTALEESEADLASGTPRRRLRGAAVLTLAGRREGVNHLREILSSNGQEAADAARFMGRYGPLTEEEHLRELLARRPEDPALLAALGEIFIRRTFPNHHAMLLRRDPTAQRFAVTGGMYDEWLAAAESAREAGVKTSAGMIAHVESMRQEARKGDQGEVIRRRLKALLEFWSQVDSIIARTGPRPAWPASFDEALELLRADRDEGKRSHRFDRRVSAAISLCANLAKVLGHEEVMARGVRLLPMSPSAERALDGNLATTWRGGPGDRLTLSIPPGAKISEILVADACPEDLGERIEALAVEAGPSERRMEVTLDAKGRYYERIPLERPISGRLTIEVIRASGEDGACVAEVRAR